MPRMIFAALLAAGSWMALAASAGDAEGPVMELSLKEQLKTYMDSYNDTPPGERLLIQFDPGNILDKISALETTIDCVSIEDLFIIECCTEGYTGACASVCAEVDLPYTGDDNACSCEIEVTSSTTATCTGSCFDGTYIDCACNSCAATDAVTDDDDDGPSPTPTPDDDDGNPSPFDDRDNHGSQLTAGAVTATTLAAVCTVTAWMAGLHA